MCHVLYREHRKVNVWKWVTILGSANKGKESECFPGTAMCRGMREAVRVCSAAAWQARGRRGPRRARCSGWPVSIRVRGTAGVGARGGEGIMGSAGNTHARPLQYSAAAPRRHTRSSEFSAHHALSVETMTRRTRWGAAARAPNTHYVRTRRWRHRLLSAVFQPYISNFSHI